MLASFTFTENAGGWAVSEASYLPIMVDAGPPLQIIDLTRAVATSPPDDRQVRYDTALARTRSIVGPPAGSEDLVEVAP